MTERLRDATIANLPASIRRPTFDRRALKPGVVHVGIGAFHRAHQAPVFQALAERGDLRWGVVGASLRSPAVRDTLVPQDCLYTLAVDDGADREISLVSVVRDVIVAPEDPARLVEAIAAPETAIVTVTVTEKGYDLPRATLTSPKTMPEHLAAGLQARRARGLGPLTIISCDNLAGNGSKLRALVREAANANDPALGEWIEQECAFPATMVDRIVPATSEPDIERISAELSVVDRGTVRTEAFWQWVIEDRFAGERPDFESVGVQVTEDIASWEQAKLRLLNGAHSAMAYLGALAGIETVDRFVAEGWGRALVELLWDEVQPTLSPSSEIDPAAYRDSLMVRFRNASLGHRLMQIAMDGSQKLPQRLVTPAVELIDRGNQPSAIALVIAAWMHFQSGRSYAGEKVQVDDPLAATTSRLVSEARNSTDQVTALLGLDAVFPRRLVADSQFAALVASHLDNIRHLGARAAVEHFVEVRV
ncbi:mannitol dehydrogenase family protein [Sphingomonas daechungensis]|uniref:mannitol dehydrogenase family protein n=1 Tax=Sphingomonas daechungensis TaxID=1176646 RepID=UPI0037843F93